MKKLAMMFAVLFSVAAFAQTPAPQPQPTKDGFYYMKATGKKIGRVTAALFGSGVKGVAHVTFADAPKAGKALGKAGYHVGKDAVGVVKAVVVDVKK